MRKPDPQPTEHTATIPIAGHLPAAGFTPGEWLLIVRGPLAGCWTRLLSVRATDQPDLPLLLVLDCDDEAASTGGPIGRLAFAVPPELVRRVPPRTWLGRLKTNLLAAALRFCTRTFAREQADEIARQEKLAAVGETFSRNLLAAEARELRRENAELRAYTLQLQQRLAGRAAAAGVGGTN